MTLFTVMNAIYLLAISGAIMAIGDIALAVWAKTDQQMFLAIGMLLNLIGILIYAQALRSGNVAIATAVLLGLNVLLVTLGSIIFLQEKITLAKMSGLLFLTGSIIFIEVV